MVMLSEYIVTMFSQNLVNVIKYQYFKSKTMEIQVFVTKVRSKLMISSVSNVVGPTED